MISEENLIERSRLQQESSMLFWYPKIAGVVPTPKTIMLETPQSQLRAFIEGESLSESLKHAIIEAARTIGYPLFLRTDQASGKHEWLRSCYVPSEDVLFNHIAAVVEFNELADIMGLPYKALVFREYIPLEAVFTAFNGLPIAKERRYFIRNGKVECHHPYWPAEAIKFYTTKEDLTGDLNDLQLYKEGPKDWKTQLQSLNNETSDEIELLTSYSETVAKQLSGYWSVDYAKAKDGRWLLIDMGRGEISWHPKQREKPDEWS